ncbi:3'-5' exonuclease [Croceicoccus gelatinilyticus]|uniref:3'-5' exonuclease n=1 Tax=Croceicoccus gelatinilyticus TaxID=2835536 RepID=UPI001BCC8F45|nr:3'-5' exonuclease [Croceicoccus gelatinilyticus]MBS7671763.1 DNA polymerase III subunit epsilon [Croceicoccus gelatinilyticus]
MNRPADEHLEQACKLLEGCDDFRILRRIKPITQFQPERVGAPSRVGIVLDTETTGLDHDDDKIIELAIQRFRFDDLGRITEIGEPRVWREDPGKPLDPQITEITGLTDEDLKGQSIDDDMACRLLDSADIIIPHNAAFDRPFVERRLPRIAGKAWACSMAEPDWRALGFEGKSLSQLLTQCGWFYDGHRAEIDILALLYLLSHVLPDGQTVLAELMHCSERPSFKVNAVDSPFDTKDRLKARGYRWDPVMRYWSKDIPVADREDEEAWLTAEVYMGRGSAVFHPISNIERYASSKITAPLQVAADGQAGR